MVKGIDEHGRFEPDEYTIYLNKSDSPEEQWSTLFHECIHVSFFLGGLSEVLGSQTEEGVVRCVENALWPLLEFKSW